MLRVLKVGMHCGGETRARLKTRHLKASLRCGQHGVDDGWRQSSGHRGAGERRGKGSPETRRFLFAVSAR